MKILCIPSVTDVVYAGIILPCGTRQETEEESGLAHFTEHMCFKGSQRFSSLQIINRMDAVGGELNAYTGKEETVYYSIFNREYVGRAVELLVEMSFNSSFPQTEIEKEREVVADEIECYNDSPSELIFDEFESLLFPNHPLGRNILGNKDHLQTYTTQHFKTFTQRNYNPDNAVFFIRGNFKEESIKKLVDKALEHISRPLSPAPCPQSLIPCPQSSVPCPSSLVLKKNTHQAHTIIGTRAYAMSDPRRIGLSLLNNILGGPGMNSRLNLALRERNGLVYTVESNYTAYTDTGIWSIYFGCDFKDVKRCLKLVKKELRRLTDAPLSERALIMAKRQLKGQLSISTDNFEQTTLSAAKRFLFTGKRVNMEEMMKEIDALTATELQMIAKDIFDETKLVTLTYE